MSERERERERERDADALSKTRSLINYLADLTDAANRNPVRDITADVRAAPDPLLWLDEFPEGIELDEAAEEVLLTLAPVRLVPPPTLPELLVGRVDQAAAASSTEPEPTLLESAAGSDELQHRLGPVTPDIRRLFERWRTEWRVWAEAEPTRRLRREFYEKLERAARTLDQRDDEYEFVLAVGLVSWRTPDDQDIRRHLLTEQVVPVLDRTGRVVVRRVPGKRRLEDRELFEGQPTYRPDRGRSEKNRLIDTDAPLLSETNFDELRGWLGLVLDAAFDERSTRPSHGVPLPATLTLSRSPALLLRPRSRVLLSEAYRRIAAALAEPDVTVPIGLAQLVVNTDRAQREQWLAAQGAARGEVLGDDPLFPLPANTEQARVMELLRTETGVVVQGPPGTGKTHTIANLVSALLARRQRVLVTSQKDQALRVLRTKIPQELRNLCVLLVGGSKDAAVELEKGLDALSAAVAANNEADLTAQAQALRAERDLLRSKGVVLNEQIRGLREAELREHGPAVPGYRTDLYRGTLAAIVRDVLHTAGDHDWMPALPDTASDVPPLSDRDIAELRQLLSHPDPARRHRLQQEIPTPQQLSTAGAFADLVLRECDAQRTAEQNTSDLARQLAELPTGQLDLQRQQIKQELHACEVGQSPPRPDREWVERALEEHFAGKNSGLWGHVSQVKDEAARLQQRLQERGAEFIINLPPITTDNLGPAHGWLNVGKPLLDHLAAGRKLRSRMLRRPQKEAQPLLDVLRVNGGPLKNAAQLRAALDRIEAEVAAVQLAQLWADVGVAVVAVTLPARLSELADNATLLDTVERIGRLHQEVSTTLIEAGILTNLSDVRSLLAVLETAPAALRHVEAARAGEQVSELHQTVRAWAARPGACPELADLVTAVVDRDIKQYTDAVLRIQAARVEQEAEHRSATLSRTLGDLHPGLLDLLTRTADDPAWGKRDVSAAWAWAKAHQFVQKCRSEEQDRQLTAEFAANEDRLRHVTGRLVANEAIRACLSRMTDEQAMALRTYRALVSKTGKKSREFRRAARAAMVKAQDAVPAWVVPLPNLLENIAAERDRFDVVIVDEASQVGIEALFLLWMAPRVIIVGDDKQCTPAASSMGQLDTVFSRNDEHLAEIDEEIRRIFTPKSHLYEVLSARSGKNAVIRLREHFRCVPEIINWSSSQFYEDGSGGSGLIPLAERKANSLEPLKVTPVVGGFTEGKDIRCWNKIEAESIVDTLIDCLADSAYDGMTFGIVVLRTAIRHIRLLDSLIFERISSGQRQERNIRVGTAPDFQGDERDVIFLSMVVADRPHKVTAESYRQSFNVAASRAKHQMWLFTSVQLDQLRSDDLRASLLSYMLHPPSVFGRSPALDEVSADESCEPFDSRFEQRVFREIKQRGYHVVPQYPVGSRTLDLVVAGAGGRIAVECDGSYWHAGVERQANDARRDRELVRMGWETVRVRESEFELDPARALDQVWAVLAKRQIEPGQGEHAEGEWQPIELPEIEDEPDEEQP